LLEIEKDMDKASRDGNSADLLTYYKSKQALMEANEKKTIRVQASIVSNPDSQSRSVKQRIQTTQKTAPLYTGKVMEDDRRIYTCDFIFVKNIDHIALCLEHFTYLKSYGLIFFRVENVEKNYVYFGTNATGQPIISELAIDTFRGFGDGLGLTDGGKMTFYDVPPAYLTYPVPDQWKVATNMATVLKIKRSVKPIPIFNPRACGARHRHSTEVLCGSMHGRDIYNMFVTFDRYWLIKALNNFGRSDKYIVPVDSEKDYVEKVTNMKGNGNISDIIDHARKSSKSEINQIEQFMPVFVLANLMLCSILGHHPQFKEHVKGHEKE
jgi:hypothetical protein